MKISVLSDNNACEGFESEHGLSFLVELDKNKVLLDTGSSDLFLRNAGKLGLNIQNDIEKVVLSHGHWDHGNGLLSLSNKVVIAHPGIFLQRYRKNDHSYIGLDFSEKELITQHDLQTTDTPLEIFPGITYLGEVPRNNTFESQTTPFVDKGDAPDFVPDDSALVVVEDESLKIITGCSHSGICNIVDHAMRITGIKKVTAIAGGLHLKHNNRQTQETMRYFRSKNISRLYPSHCTGIDVVSAFMKDFEVKQLKAGKILDV